MLDDFLNRIREFRVAFRLDFEYLEDGEDGKFVRVFFLGDSLTEEGIEGNDEFGVGFGGVFVVLFGDISVGFFEEQNFLIGEGKGGPAFKR